MNTYHQLLKIRVQHSYYTSELCTQLIFTPTQETENLIRNHRLLVKYRPAGVDVFAKKDKTGHFLIPLGKGLILNWLLRPDAPSFFYKITNLPAKNSNGQYKISNEKSGMLNAADFGEYGGLTDQQNAPVTDSFGSLSRSFTGIQQLKTGDTTITLNRAPVLGTSIQAFTVTDTIDDKNVSLAANPNVTDQLNLNTAFTKETTIKLSYPVAAQAGKNVFAKMAISLDDYTNKSLNYTLKLKAKKLYRDYLFQHPFQDLSGNWALKEGDLTRAGNLKNATELQNLTDPTYALVRLAWEKLRTEQPNTQVFWFRSQEKHALMEKPGFPVNLQKDNNIILTNLPAASIHTAGLQIISKSTISII